MDGFVVNSLYISCLVEASSILLDWRTFVPCFFNWLVCVCCEDGSRPFSYWIYSLNLYSPSESPKERTNGDIFSSALLFTIDIHLYVHLKRFYCLTVPRWETRTEFNSILQFINVELQRRWGLCPSIRRPSVWIIFGLFCPVVLSSSLSITKRYPFSDPTQTKIGCDSIPAVLLVSKDKHNWLNQSKSIWSMYLMFVNSQNLLSLNVEWKASEEKGNGQAAG